VRQLLPLQEDQGGLEPAVGHEEVAAKLRQGTPVFRHVRLLLSDLVGPFGMMTNKAHRRLPKMGDLCHIHPTS
jgi:hypothetical protein